jgi:hypothetical protein
MAVLYGGKRKMSLKIKLVNGIKAVKYARLRVAGLERAYDQESDPKVKRALMTYLRKEKDKLSDYEVTGIYEED